VSEHLAATPHGIAGHPSQARFRKLPRRWYTQKFALLLPLQLMRSGSVMLAE
jgi:hypothetical protein